MEYIRREHGAPREEYMLEMDLKRTEPSGSVSSGPSRYLASVGSHTILGKFPTCVCVCGLVTRVTPISHAMNKPCYEQNNYKVPLQN